MRPQWPEILRKSYLGSIQAKMLIKCFFRDTPHHFTMPPHAEEFKLQRSLLKGKLSLLISYLTNLQYISLSTQVSFFLEIDGSQRVTEVFFSKIFLSYFLALVSKYLVVFWRGIQSQTYICIRMKFRHVIKCNCDDLKIIINTYIGKLVCM